MALRVSDGCEHYEQCQAPAELDELTRQLALKYGTTYASYLAAEPGWETFACPGRKGVVRFARRYGWFSFNVAGLLAAPEDRAFLLDHFRKFLKANGLYTSFANLTAEELTPFREQGFEITKIGEEPLVRLGTITWQGKDFEWVRRQENFCLRQGLSVDEIKPDPSDPIYRDTIVPELLKISREHLAGTVHGWELRYFEGRFRPLEMISQRLFIVRGPGRIEAFIVCNPGQAGSLWAIEMYRRREDAPRGVVPFAWMQIMRLLKQEGVEFCSLSATPAVRCETPQAGDSWLVRQTCMAWWNYGNWLFDMRGIYHFKSRFRPEYRDLYIATWPKATALSLIALGRTWGLIKLDPWRLVSHGLKMLAKHSTRKTLSEPDTQPQSAPTAGDHKRAA